ncbi:MAG: hypothetical protein MZV49_15805 [Rhodopseudomonas palustris]|nr:hypothetical protein [Rhodopseudomonas palustris]
MPIPGTRVLVPFKMKIPTPLGNAVLEAAQFVAAATPRPRRRKARTAGPLPALTSKEAGIVAGETRDRCGAWITANLRGRTAAASQRRPSSIWWWIFRVGSICWGDRSQGGRPGQRFGRDSFPDSFQV